MYFVTSICYPQYNLYSIIQNKQILTNFDKYSTFGKISHIYVKKERSGLLLSLLENQRHEDKDKLIWDVTVTFAIKLIALLCKERILVD